MKKLHVGHLDQEYKFQDMMVDRWTEVELINDETGEVDTKDILDGEQLMEEKTRRKISWGCDFH